MIDCVVFGSGVRGRPSGVGIGRPGGRAGAVAGADGVGVSGARSSAGSDCAGVSAGAMKKSIAVCSVPRTMITTLTAISSVLSCLMTFWRVVSGAASGSSDAGSFRCGLGRLGAFAAFGGFGSFGLLDLKKDSSEKSERFGAPSSVASA